MNRIIRKNTFETNSSSIHSLAINQDSQVKDFSDVDFKIEPFTYRDLYDFGNVFTDLKDKLRYLWTIRCYEQDNGDDNFVDEFTSMLKSIFPKVIFIDVENVPYMEDYEDIINDPKILDETFIRKLLNDGKIVFTSRDYYYDDYESELFIDNVRKNSENHDLTIYSEG